MKMKSVIGASVVLALGWMPLGYAGDETQQGVGQMPDLPVVGQGQELPAVGQGQELPAVGQGQELPAVGQGQELPAVGQGQELPAVGQGQELPVVAPKKDIPKEVPVVTPQEKPVQQIPMKQVDEELIKDTKGVMVRVKVNQQGQELPAQQQVRLHQGAQQATSAQEILDAWEYESIELIPDSETDDPTVEPRGFFFRRPFYRGFNRGFYPYYRNPYGYYGFGRPFGFYTYPYNYYYYPYAGFYPWN